MKNDEAANLVKGIGTGETFLVTCFAGEVGIPAVSLKNFLGDCSSSGDSRVSNRVFAQIAAFMSNTELRGKVIWFLLTCRPDLLPVDLKRQGRAEEHIALFYPTPMKSAWRCCAPCRRRPAPRWPSRTPRSSSWSAPPGFPAPASKPC